MAQNRTLPEVLGSIVSGIAKCEHVALARIWLLNPGDLCSACRFREECPDQTRCLHLVASAGTSADPDRDHTRTDGTFRRFPLGVRKIGQIAKSGQPLLLAGVHGSEAWIADRDWCLHDRVQSFAGQPLVCRGEVRVFADHAAVSIANANAFEEIAFLKERLEEEINYLREEVTAQRGASEIIGDSPALRKMLQQIDLVAPTDATVLITGESGTGKELIARGIHERSPRNGRPLVTVNCGAVPEALFESEFFGHVRGAFTGALRDKAGRFELADGGTLFLDEIGEVPLPMQAKLLRVLQEQEIERVGDTRTRKVNVRILAATNRDLRAEVAAGRFRQDLFYRLSVFPIESPPLRERRDDIPTLAEHFIRTAAKRMNRRPPKLSAAAARELAAQDWPGNVRELQNTIERAVILAQNGPLVFDAPAAPSPKPALENATVFTRTDLKQRERESITAALAQTAGKIFGPDGAAALLHMKPTTLASRIKALGLRRM